jgi:hypothetical protein
MIADRYERNGGEGFFGTLKSREPGRIWVFQNGSCLCYNAQKDAVFEIHGAIYDKWLSLGGLSFGVPCTDEMAAPDGRGRYNRFNDGGASIYWTPTTNAAAIYGAIHEKWKSLGRERSPLGYPTTDELGTPDGVGRYNHFEHGSIYWTPATGAAAIYGAIRDKWASLDWERSYLGYPTSDETEFPEGGRVNTFQNGGIYWWSDTGAIDLRDVVVHYTGLHCFGETDWDQGSDADEPYLILSVATPLGSATTHSPVYKNVDAGETRTELIEIYRGRPFGMTIGVLLMEQDWGDADHYTAIAANIVARNQWSLVELLGLHAVAGPMIAAGVWPQLAALVPNLGLAAVNAMDLGDDRIDSANLTLSPRQMVVLAAGTNNSEFAGIGFKAESPLLSGLGASYKAFFGLVPA